MGHALSNDAHVADGIVAADDAASSPLGETGERP
jgi:hypothetical protein